MQVTPEKITELKENEVFVFGSNLAGIHGAGSARFAYDRFGACLGKGYGWYYKSFAIPTKDEHIKTLPLEVIQTYVQGFEAFVIANPMLTFYVTQIGCGLAGYTPKDIAPLFKSCYQLPNVYMPKEFWSVYNGCRT